MSGPNVRVSADISGVNKSLEDFRRKAKEVTQDLNGAKVSIDPSKAKKGLEDLEKAAKALHDTLQRAVGGEIGAGGLGKLNTEFEEAVQHAQSLQQVVTAIGGTGAAGFNASVSSVRNLVREMEKAQRLQAALRKEGHTVSPNQAADLEREFQRRIQLGGRGTRKLKKFGDLASVVSNWRDLSPMSELDARREHRDLLGSFGLSNHPAPGHPPAPAPGAPRPQTFAQFALHSASQAGRGIVHAVTPNMGIGSSIMSNAAGAAAETSGGALSGAGIARLAGGAGIAALAFGTIKAAGAVKNKINSAEEESISYADLGRSTNSPSSFADLRHSVRAASTSMGVSYATGANLAQRYASEAGVDGMSKDAMRTELSGAGGFARSFGLDPGRGVDLYGSLRHNKVANSSNDLKRVGLMIGEGIAKAGVFSKADDVLSAVTNFTAQATRASFAPANVGGFMGGMSSLMGAMPGLDPSMASSMLGKADNAIRSNGNEAFRNFLLGSAQQSMPGMNAFDIGFLRDGGAFGTAESAYGANSQAVKMAQARGDKPLEQKYLGFAKSGGKELNIDRIMRQMESSSGGTEALVANLKSMGYSDTEAAAMMTAYAKHGSIGKATAQFGKMGVDPSKMSDSSMKSLLSIEYGDDAARQKQVKYLRGLGGAQKLSGAEGAQLDAAVASKDDGKLKAALIKLSASRDMETNEGDASRRNIANIDNATSEMATKLIPMMNSIREGVMAIASKLPGFEDKYGNSEKSMGRLDAALAAVPAGKGADRVNLLRSELEEVTKNPEKYTQDYVKSVQEQYSAADGAVPNARAAGAGSDAPSATTPMAKNKADFLVKSRNGAAAAAALINQDGWNMRPEWLQAQVGLETGWGQSVLNGTNNVGNIKAGKDWKGKRATFNVKEYNPVSKKMDLVDQDFRVYDSQEDGWKDYAKLLKNSNRYSEVRGATNASQFAHAMGRSGYATDPKYTQKLLSSLNGIPAGAAATKVPDAADAATEKFGKMPVPGWAAPKADAGANSNVFITGEFLLKDQSTGRSLAEPIRQSFNSAPRPAGVRG